jgi:hypothetical protein
MQNPLARFRVIVTQYAETGYGAAKNRQNGRPAILSKQVFPNGIDGCITDEIDTCRI